MRDKGDNLFNEAKNIKVNPLISFLIDRRLIISSKLASKKPPQLTFASASHRNLPPLFPYFPSSIDYILYMHNSTLSHTKQPVYEPPREHLEVFKSIDTFLQDLNVRIKKQVEVMEAAKLQSYKDDLLRTKQQFDEINEKKNDSCIKKAVFAQKKQLEKQCTGFLEGSMEVSKLYESLKGRLVIMQSTSQELEHEIQYLQKQINTAGHKNQALNRELKTMQEQTDNMKLKRKTSASELPVFGSGNKTVQTSVKPSKESKQIEKMMNRTAKWKQNSEKRLISRMEATRQFLNSLAFQKSTIELLFQGYDLKSYESSQKKLQLMEQLLSEPSTKQTMYRLLFQNSRK